MGHRDWVTETTALTENGEDFRMTAEILVLQVQKEVRVGSRQE